jgi:hypothetical protein
LLGEDKSCNSVKSYLLCESAISCEADDYLTNLQCTGGIDEVNEPVDEEVEVEQVTDSEQTEEEVTENEKTEEEMIAEISEKDLKEKYTDNGDVVEDDTAVI